jgi:DNA-binding response OmpR family regulator
MLQNASIAVVDDEPAILSMVADYLGREGYRVSRCVDASELDRALEGDTPDLVVLDVNLPGEDGISIARRLQAFQGVSIVMLSGLGDPIDRVVGLEVGADDYVTKPFDPRELAARVRAVLRRAQTADGRPAAAKSAPLSCSPTNAVSFGEAFLDLDARRLVDRSGSDLPLTATEFNMLATFARHPNRVLTRDALLDNGSQQGSSCCYRAVDIRVTRLRKRIEVNPTRPQVIRTVRSIGYVYVPPG